MRRRSAILAAFLSLIQPGAGQLFAGRYSAAVAIWVAGLLLALALFRGVMGRSFSSLALVVLAVAALCAYSAVHAYRATRGRLSSQRWFERWYVCLPLFVAASLVVQPQLERFQRLKPFYFPSASMEPTLLRGDHFIVDRFAYRKAPVTRGDIVCFESPEHDGHVLRQASCRD